MAIPVSYMCSVPHQKHFDNYIRFCFVKVRAKAGEGRPPQGGHLVGVVREVGLICVGAG